MQQPLPIPVPRRSSRMTMGIKGLAIENWIDIDENFVDYLNQKKQLLDHQYSDVFASLPGTQAAQKEVLDLVLDHVLTHFPKYYSDQNQEQQNQGHPISQIKNLMTQDIWYLNEFEENPLDLAGRLIQEDLCLMQRQSEHYILSGASLCFPHHWRLAEKLGNPVSQIHAPVPGYAKNLEQPVDRFFDRLRSDIPVYRSNWGIVGTPALFYPSSDSQSSVAPSLTLETIGEKLWLRIEKQTLRRLPKTETILFTIRTYIYPLSIVETDLTAAQTLAELVQQLSPEMQAYKNISSFQDLLITYLTRIALIQ
jgi:dimethylamine monooxygenase subunit A